MLENGVIINNDGLAIYWHRPIGRTSASLPDSSDLFWAFWNNREHILGFAHSHPGRGIPVASWEDITTFDAIERALGRLLTWWITSEDTVVVYEAASRNNYIRYIVDDDSDWLKELRAVSY